MDTPLNLQSDDFALFQVPARFAQDTTQLRQTWRALQAKAHPDQFASAGASAKRLAMQWSVRINEAFDRLKNPLSRAAYLCALRGQPVDAERNTAMPTAFLMQQMAWREMLEDANTPDAADALVQELTASEQDCLARIAALLDAPSETESALAETNLAEASQQVRALMFIQKVLTEAQSKADTLADAASL